jgi:hypothetical protein
MPERILVRDPGSEGLPNGWPVGHQPFRGGVYQKTVLSQEAIGVGFRDVFGRSKIWPFSDTVFT